MPAAYIVDADRSLVLSRGWGAVTGADLLMHVRSLRTDPRFQPQFSQLFDFRATTDVRVDAQSVREIAAQNPFGAGARRAFVVANDVAFGMARMYQILTEVSPDELEVFRDLDEALRWLGVAEAKAELLRTLSGLPPLPDTGRSE